MIARLKAAGPALFAVLAAVTLIGVSSTGTHLVRLPDRGTGWTRLRSSGDTLVAAGFFSHRAAAFGRDGARRHAWRFDEPIMDAVPDDTGRFVLALPYFDDDVYLLDTVDGTSRTVRVLARGPEPAVVAAAAYFDGWYAVLVERYHDGTRQKKFPYINPDQMPFRYRIVRFDRFTKHRALIERVWFEGTAEWHEESFHPWDAAFDARGRTLAVLNTMSEELSAYDRATGERLYVRPVGPRPVALLVWRDRALVACPEQNRIDIFDLRTGVARTPIHGAPGVDGLAGAEYGVFAASKYRRSVLRAIPSNRGWYVTEVESPEVPGGVAALGGVPYLGDAVYGRVRSVEGF